MCGDPEPTGCRHAFIRSHERRCRDQFVYAHLRNSVPIEQEEILIVLRDLSIEKYQTRIAV